MDNKEIQNNNKDKSFCDLYMDKRIERFGEEEIKARQVLNRKVVNTIIFAVISFFLSFILPICAIYFPYAIIKIIVMYIKYYRKSDFNVLNKKKKGR